MPITISNRNVGSGNGSMMIPLIANNPAFNVAILPVDGRMEQKPYAKNANAQINAIKVGNTVRGSIVNSDKDVEGKVLQINRQNNEVVSYKILTGTGEEVLIDPSSASKKIEHGQDTEVVGGINYNDVPQGVSNESQQVISYQSWMAKCLST
jgi:hypothetical protein